MLVDTIEALVRSQKYGNQDVHFGGSTPPTSPTDNALWFETPTNPSSPYPQPWIYNTANTVWLSQPFRYEFPQRSALSATTAMEVNIPFYGVTGNRFLIRQVNGIVTNVNTTTAHTAANYYAFRISYTVGTAIPTPEVVAYDFTTNTIGLEAQGSRRILENTNIWIPGNAWALRFFNNKIGVAPNISSSFSAIIQYARA